MRTTHRRSALIAISGRRNSDGAACAAAATELGSDALNDCFRRGFSSHAPPAQPPALDPCCYWPLPIVVGDYNDDCADDGNEGVVHLTISRPTTMNPTTTLPKPSLT